MYRQFQIPITFHTETVGEDSDEKYAEPILVLTKRSEELVTNFLTEAEEKRWTIASWQVVMDEFPKLDGGLPGCILYLVQTLEHRIVKA